MPALRVRVHEVLQEFRIAVYTKALTTAQR
jgi:hypothetical protein